MSTAFPVGFDPELDLLRQILNLYPNSFYQVITMIDIFQYSNMYTVKPSVHKVASEENVAAECGMYVTRECESMSIADENLYGH